MNEKLPNAESAALIFVDMLIARAYDGVITDIKTSLDEGVHLKGHRLNTLHAWYKNQDQETQQMVLEIAIESIEAAVFGCLVVLDGLTGGPPLREYESDFALYLQTYDSDEARDSNTFQNSVRINPEHLIIENLHDIFQRILQERATSDK